MDQRRVDYIIVGLGLAGACLAIQLLSRKKSILVLDTASENQCTSVAAGLINPITGKMLSKTWLADEVLPYQRSFYKSMEAQFGKQLHHEIPIYSPFHSAEEQNNWMGRSTYAHMSKYIEKVYSTPVFSNDVYDPAGGVLLAGGGYLDTNAFVEAVRAHLIKFGAYRDERLAGDELRFEPVTYRGVRADKIIFCRGVAEVQEDLFDWVPLRPLKGETITIRTRTLDRIYNKGVYIVPGREADTYHVGATYDRNGAPGVTVAGRNDLVNSLDELLRHPYEIINHQWGIRPTTVDRRPVLGAHPVHKNALIFNGLGTKGLILAPYFSGRLAAVLVEGGEIMREVNITRFKSLYSRFDD